MFWTFLATALLAVLTVLWRLRPTKAHSIKAVTLSGMEAAMVILLTVSMDLLIQHFRLDEHLMLQAFIYLLASAGLLFMAKFAMTAWNALWCWYRQRHEGGQHFDFG